MVQFISWRHINLLGEYDFSDEKLEDTVGIRPPDWQPERPWGTWSRESGEISVFRRAYTRPYVALRTFVGIEP